MKLVTALLAAAAALSVTASPVVVDERGLNAPAGFQITSLTVTGTGCPVGTYDYDLNTGTLIFDNFVAEVGPGIPLPASRRMCQLSIRVKIPPGYAFKVASINYRGFTQLDEKVTAKQQARYFFQGPPSSASSLFTGPIVGRTYINLLSFSSPPLSPCGGNAIVQIITNISVDNSANKLDHGLFTVDSFDPVFSWVKC